MVGLCGILGVVFGGARGSFGDLEGPLGALGGTSEDPLGFLRALGWPLGEPGGEGSWGLVGWPLGDPGGSLGDLEDSWGLLGVLGGHLGALRDPWGGPREAQGGSWGGSGAL